MVPYKVRGQLYTCVLFNETSQSLFRCLWIETRFAQIPFSITFCLKFSPLPTQTRSKCSKLALLLVQTCPHLFCLCRPVFWFCSVCMHVFTLPISIWFPEWDEILFYFIVCLLNILIGGIYNAWTYSTSQSHSPNVVNAVWCEFNSRTWVWHWQALNLYL